MDVDLTAKCLVNKGSTAFRAFSCFIHDLTTGNIFGFVF